MRTHPFLPLLAAILAEGRPQTCPPNGDIQPCKCEIQWDHKISVTCGNSLENPAKLRQIARQLHHGANADLELNSLSMQHIPGDVPRHIQSLRVNGGAMTQLFNRSPRSGLRELILKSVHLERGMSFDLLTHMKNLSALSLENVSVPIIGEDFQDGVTPELAFLYFVKTSTQKITQGALSRLRNLSVLMIVDNKIAHLQRAVLPFPSKLEILFLNKNLLTSLPRNIFSGMPKLRTVSLRDNRLTALDYEIFEPISRHLEYLDVYENPLNCDCHVKWLITNEPRTQIFGSCLIPERLQEKSLKDLIPDDFQSCD